MEEIGVAAVVGVLLVLGLVFYSVSGLIIDVICSILFHPVVLLDYSLYFLCAGFSGLLLWLYSVLKAKEGQHTGITRSIHQSRAVYHTSSL